MLKNRDDDEPQLLGEIMDAVNDIAENNNVPNLTLDQRVAMLNSDQKRIYDKIKQHYFNKTKAAGGFVK